jgi:hypothetical protein
MPTWLKVLLIVGGLLFVLVVAAAVGLFYVARTYGPRLAEAGKHSMEEGREYGRRTDNEGCLNEAVARHARAEGFQELLKNTLFLTPCLEASKPTPHFCDDVPGRMEIMKGAQWQMDECKRYGLKPESQCGQLFQQVQQFCERRRAEGTGGAGAEEEDADEGDDAGTEPPPPPAPPPTPAPAPSR